MRERQRREWRVGKEHPREDFHQEASWGGSRAVGANQRASRVEISQWWLEVWFGYYREILADNRVAKQSMSKVCLHLQIHPWRCWGQITESQEGTGGTQPGSLGNWAWDKTMAVVLETVGPGHSYSGARMPTARAGWKGISNGSDLSWWMASTIYREIIHTHI